MRELAGEKESPTRTGWRWWAGLYGGCRAPVRSDRADFVQGRGRTAPVTDLGQLRDDSRNFSTTRSFPNSWAMAARHRGRIPARHAGRIAAPVMLVHGEFVEQAPYKHLELMADALRDAGKSARFLQFPGMDTACGIRRCGPHAAGSDEFSREHGDEMMMRLSVSRSAQRFWARRRPPPKPRRKRPRASAPCRRCLDVALHPRATSSRSSPPPGTVRRRSRLPISSPAGRPSASSVHPDPDSEPHGAWAAEDRLVCRVSFVIKDAGTLLGFSRMVSISDDGKDVIPLTSRDSNRATGIQQNGGSIPALELEGKPDKILMTRDWVEERSTGTRTANTDEGRGSRKSISAPASARPSNPPTIPS